MGLLEQARLDNRAILGDESAFGERITVTNPDGLSRELVGFSRDIELAIDPQTGQAVVGRTAGVSFAMGTLTEAGFTDLPRGEPDEKRRPWVVRFKDARGVDHTFKVIEVSPDRTLGLIVCTLEGYRG